MARSFTVEAGGVEFKGSTSPAKAQIEMLHIAGRTGLIVSLQEGASDMALVVALTQIHPDDFTTLRKLCFVSGKEDLVVRTPRKTSTCSSVARWWKTSVLFGSSAKQPSRARRSRATKPVRGLVPLASVRGPGGNLPTAGEVVRYARRNLRSGRCADDALRDGRDRVSSGARSQ